jgi:hypothetical protein
VLVQEQLRQLAVLKLVAGALRRQVQGKQAQQGRRILGHPWVDFMKQVFLRRNLRLKITMVQCI